MCTITTTTSNYYYITQSELSVLDSSVYKTYIIFKLSFKLLFCVLMNHS